MAVAEKPTRKQLSYLRSLANSRGQTFSYPHSRREASAEIERLKRQRPDQRADVARERRDIQAAMATERGDASRVQPDELVGHGASARWNRDDASRASRSASRAAGGTVGERRELARYDLTSGQRVICGQRINGVVRLVDLPGSGEGRSYLIERELHANGELQALIADYVAQARRHDAIPCHVHWR